MRLPATVIALALCFLAAAVGAIVAEEAPTDPIQSTISRQLDAFRADDGATAFAIASPDIQAMFGTPEVFLQMVAKSYPQVYRPRTVRFLALTRHDDRYIQRVLVQGPDGAFVTALYEMVEVDGAWRINGCALVAEKGTGI